MDPLAFSMPYCIAFWTALAWAFVPEAVLVARSKKHLAGRPPEDSGSLQLIVFGLGLADCAALPLAFVELTQFPVALRFELFVAGIVILVVGSLLRRHCWRILGDYFTAGGARPGQPVIHHGAYRWVRHPSYSASLLMHVGYGIALGSWGATLLVVTACMFVYRYRMASEERSLIQTVGEPYLDYIRQRRRLIPGIY